jgi:hypothetical protein
VEKVVKQSVGVEGLVKELHLVSRVGGAAAKSGDVISPIYSSGVQLGIV